MRFLIIIIAVLICTQCKGQTKDIPQQEDTLKTIENSGKADGNLSINQQRISSLKQLKLKADSLSSYNLVKQSIEKQKVKSNSQNIDSISNLFEKSLLHRIIPYWEGTEWSFEGHTSRPREGTIACGYFVSTTLQDAGLNINRYRLAQQSPINEAKSLAMSSEVVEIVGDSNVQNIISIKEKIPEGIHFIGFDQSHVGYILKEKGQLYLIHSNYLNARGVEIESIEESEVFSSYNRFYIVEISTNENLLKNWSDRTAVAVIKE